MNTEQMTLTRCQVQILTESKWFVWSKTSYSGDVTPVTHRQTDRQWKVEQYSAEAESAIPQLSADICDTNI